MRGTGAEEMPRNSLRERFLKKTQKKADIFDKSSLKLLTKFDFIAKINVDEERELALQFKVQSIPTVAFVKDNTLLDVSVGFVPKDKLAKMIGEYK